LVRGTFCYAPNHTLDRKNSYGGNNTSVKEATKNCSASKRYGNSQSTANGKNTSAQHAFKPDAIKNFVEKEVDDKVVKGQVRVVLWEDIKDNHPGQLKVSSVAAIPHKSRAYRSILDLSFVLRLEDGASSNQSTSPRKKGAPRGAINQLGHFLKCIVHVFAEANDDAVILMAKRDIQDGFSGSSTAAKERSGISAIYIATVTNGTMPAGGTKLATNGMGGLCTIFLRCIRHGKRHCSQL